jgi:hypothetical protein
MKPQCVLATAHSDSFGAAPGWGARTSLLVAINQAADAARDRDWAEIYPTTTAEEDDRVDR